MSNVVLDSYSLFSYFGCEPGAEIVAQYLKQAKRKQNSLFLSLINWGEIYYITSRRQGKAVAESMLSCVNDLPILVVGVDEELTKAAATIKATNKMSYADCFAAALAKSKKASLVTGDKEFRAVEKEIPIIWI